MRLLGVLVACAVSVASSHAPRPVNYEGFSVLHLKVTKDIAQEVLPLLENWDVDIWASGLNWMDVMVGPQQQVLLAQALGEMSIDFDIKIPNVQRLIERDYENLRKRKSEKEDKTFNFDVYHTFDEVEKYLHDIASSSKLASLESIGQSLEGRQMWQLKIARNASIPKKKVWVDCGIHAREWVAPATCLWGINEFLNEKNHIFSQALEHFEFWIMPIYNPDGYVYTETDRMWRKNRRTFSNSRCVGVDLNRNFDDHFGVAGASSWKCSDIYNGEYASSEPETQNAQKAIDAIVGEAAALYTLHSYSQLWLFPYGWTEKKAPDYEDLNNYAKKGVAAIESVNGRDFVYGPISTTIYPASGGTIDYSYAKGITQSHAFELRDKGRYGFLLPEDQIVPAAEEAWAGLLTSVLSLTTL